MSKNKSAKRKRVEPRDAPNKRSKTQSVLSPPPESTSLDSLVSQEELEITIETLQTLTGAPSIVKSKTCKSLRAALYDFHQACATGVNTSAEMGLTGRISTALTHEKYTDALVLLAEMRIRWQAPKLGALCRWVRELDVVSGLSMQVDGISRTTTPRSQHDLLLLKVLDAILRVTCPIDPQPRALVSPASPIDLQEPWNVRTSPNRHQLRSRVLDGSIYTTVPGNIINVGDVEKNFCVISYTIGADRKPPNHDPAVLYLSEPNTIRLEERNNLQTARIPHPSVADLSIIKDVLSPSECEAIIAATEKIGFTPDAPIRSDGEEASVLAHNFYWLVDQPFHDALWSRVCEHVPAEIGGRRRRGLNRRFRVYRYVPGAEYRCHIDGAWPPSGQHPQTGAYMYDSSPAGARQSSLLTFLIYLNDEFEAGETTFFIPSAVDGVMNAYPVKPVLGSVAMFPHGEARGALLHEGTGVRHGAKYVIRTDVEYDVLATL